MEHEKRIDFDAALAEKRAARTSNDDAPLVVRLFGDDWELPGTIPAGVTAQFPEWVEAGLIDDAGHLTEGAEVSAIQALQLVRAMVPRDVFEAWCDRGLSTSDYLVGLELIMDAYGRPAGNRAARRAPAKRKPAAKAALPRATSRT